MISAGLFRRLLPAVLVATGLSLGAARVAAAPAAAAATTTTIAQPTAEALAAKVQAYYEKSRDLTADVSQRYRFQAAGRTLKATGTLEVKKPGMLRWTVQKPSPKEFIIDGKSLVLYDAEDNSVILKKEFSAESMPAAVAFLWGQGQLLRDFVVTLAARPQDGARVLELVPKRPQPGFQRLYFAVDEATGQVQVSVVVDKEGNENRLAFSNVRTNVGLPDARFHFDIPKGATVTRQ